MKKSYYSDLRAALGDPLVDAHHLLESRFLDVLGEANPVEDFPTIPLPRSADVLPVGVSSPTHRFDPFSVTEMLRAEIPHGLEAAYTPQQIWDAHARLYSRIGHPELLEDIKPFFEGEGVEFRIPDEPTPPISRSRVGASLARGLGTTFNVIGGVGFIMQVIHLGRAFEGREDKSGNPIVTPEEFLRENPYPPGTELRDTAGAIWRVSADGKDADLIRLAPARDIYGRLLPTTTL